MVLPVQPFGFQSSRLIIHSQACESGAQASLVNLLESEQNTKISGEHSPEDLPATAVISPTTVSRTQGGAMSKKSDAGLPTPVPRKQSIRARVEETEPADAFRPFEGRIDVLHAAKTRLGLSNPEIGALIGVTERTIRRALRLDPSVSMGTICALINVLGLEMVDVFPPREEEATGTEDGRTQHARSLHWALEVSKAFYPRRKRW